MGKTRRILHSTVSYWSEVVGRPFEIVYVCVEEEYDIANHILICEGWFEEHTCRFTRIFAMPGTYGLLCLGIIMIYLLHLLFEGITFLYLVFITFNIFYLYRYLL